MQEVMEPRGVLVSQRVPVHRRRCCGSGAVSGFGVDAVPLRTSFPRRAESGSNFS